MRSSLSLILVAGCTTTNPSSTAQDPPVMFAGGSVGTPTSSPSTGGPSPGAVIPSPCAFSLFRVASGVDIDVSWYDLTEDPDGNPIDPPTNATGGMRAQPLSVDAATAESVCTDPAFGDLLTTGRIVSLDEQPEATIPADLLPEGGMTLVMLWHYNVPAAFLVEPVSSSDVREIYITTEEWAL